ncbi:MAG: cyclase family protein, partial [Hyphomicrobiaceae bacterium]
DAAEWLLERNVKMIAVDTIDPELPSDLRPDGFDFPVHRKLLQQGVLIAEQLAKLNTLAGRRVEFLFAPLPIVGCDGAPARVLGRTVN